MPPFDLSWTPTLENKLSTQIDGQLPDFIAEDHPKFSRFLKHYYQFLEAGELRVDVNIDNILLEIETSTNLLSEDGTLVVTEIGSGSTGKFAEGETITGGTSYATATVLVEDLGNENPRLFISSQQLFETGETITGATSGASGTDPICHGGVKAERGQRLYPRIDPHQRQARQCDTGAAPARGRGRTDPADHQRKRGSAGRTDRIWADLVCRRQGYPDA